MTDALFFELFALYVIAGSGFMAGLTCFALQSGAGHIIKVKFKSLYEKGWTFSPACAGALWLTMVFFWLPITIIYSVLYYSYIVTMSRYAEALSTISEKLAEGDPVEEADWLEEEAAWDALPPAYRAITTTAKLREEIYRYAGRLLRDRR